MDTLKARQHSQRAQNKKQRVASKRAQRKVQAKMVEKNHTSKTIKKQHEVPQPTPNKAVTVLKKAKAVKQTAAKQRKKVKMMSEKKFQALKFKMRLNITISKKEREIYEEQRVLRDLKKFLG